MDIEEILKGLNSDQRKAVLHDHEKNAQLLILAGAGSGKTSVLTKRIQYRISLGVPPESILSLTFTAKAALEMKERVCRLFPDALVRLCTFHSLALFLLKIVFLTSIVRFFNILNILPIKKFETSKHFKFLLLKSEIINSHRSLSF